MNVKTQGNLFSYWLADRESDYVLSRFPTDTYFFRHTEIPYTLAKNFHVPIAIEYLQIEVA